MPQLFGLCRLGRDVDLRYTADGQPVANLALAFEYGRKGPDGKRPTQWIDASLWGKRAESLAPHLPKGTRLAVTLDDVHVETFQRRDGTEGSKLLGQVSSIEFAGSSQASASQPTQQREPSRHDMPEDPPF